VVFESKTKLIELYLNKYGAMLLGGRRMAFNDDAGQKLIDRYLQILT
jgi:hypothetical protein